MDQPLTTNQDLTQTGEDWVAALASQDFERLASLIHPQVHSRMLTPKNYFDLQSLDDMVSKLRGWFGGADSIQIQQTRIHPVGDSSLRRRLGIFYRFLVHEQGRATEIEQQVYVFLAGGLIEQLDLVCSGFQPAADALLVVNAQSEAYGSTCAILTPSIKARLRDMASGQVLEVQVDDSSVREDIEAWCRLSGNELLKMDAGGSQGIQFFLKKK